MGSGYTAPMRRAPRRISAAYLSRVTTHYLERYASSRGNLRRLLMQRVKRSAEHHGDDPADGARLVDAELDRLEQIGLLNDASYATDKARSMLRRGAGARKIGAALGAKGVPREVIDAALEELCEGVDPDIEAAWTFARKRGLGPWRRVAGDDDRRRKELARMGRAGFSFELARQVVDATDRDRGSA